jgi:hypothetical protein
MAGVICTKYCAKSARLRRARQPGLGFFSTENPGWVLPFMPEEEYRVGKMVEWL